MVLSASIVSSKAFIDNLTSESITVEFRLTGASVCILFSEGDEDD
jgi:hypothetical protein